MSGAPVAEPRLLLVTAHRWLHTTRLALAAHQAGFTVALHGPAGHPVAELDWVEPVGVYSALQPRRSVSRALDRYAPDLVVPVDDLTSALLLDPQLRSRLSSRNLAVVDRSLGGPASDDARGDRVAVAQALAPAVGGPLTVRVDDHASLLEALDRTGLPAVIKVDRSTGGQGVVVVENLDEARHAYERLRRRTTLRRCVGGLLRDDDPNHVLPFLTRRRPDVCVQAFVPGENVTLTAMCWEGRLLGSVALRVLRTSWHLGPATVVEPVDDPALSRVAANVVEVLGLSGLAGMDFVVDADGAPQLVELNARATPTSHLRTASPGPLLGLLARSFGSPGPEDGRAATALLNPVALFPQERSQHPDSPYVDTEHEDLPQDAPDVLELCRRRIVSPIPSVPMRVARYARARRGARR